MQLENRFYCTEFSCFYTLNSEITFDSQRNWKHRSASCRPFIQPPLLSTFYAQQCSYKWKKNILKFISAFSVHSFHDVLVPFLTVLTCLLMMHFFRASFVMLQSHCLLDSKPKRGNSYLVDLILSKHNPYDIYPGILFLYKIEYLIGRKVLPFPHFLSFCSAEESIIIFIGMYQCQINFKIFSV